MNRITQFQFFLNNEKSNSKNTEKITKLPLRQRRIRVNVYLN